jgi:hypothetical protein
MPAAICRFNTRWVSLLTALAFACSSGEPSGGLGPGPTGSLVIGISGLPAAVPATVAVTGGQGYQKNLTSGQTLSGLAPGNYAVSASEVVTEGDRYAPTPASQSVAVTSGGAPVSAGVTYVLATGRLAVTISGLPAGAEPSVLVSGPGGYVNLLSASALLTGLAPGTYTVYSPDIVVSGTQYGAPVPQQQVPVTATVGSAAQVLVGYSVSTGALQVVVAGLPGGGAASVTVSGPGGFSQNLSSSQTLSSLIPGSYTVSAFPVSTGGTTYTPVPAIQNVAVGIGSSPLVTITYTSSVGSLNLTVSGLPGGVPANITVTGPGGFSQPLNGSLTLSGLSPGSYSVAAASVASGNTTYTPAPLNQSVQVTAGATTPASVSYTGSVGGATLNLMVNGVYLTQATQRYDGSVPLVAGRNAYLRAFALASQPNSVQTPVRVRLYHGSTLVQTYSITPPAGGVPTTVNEAALTSSWNVLVPGSLVQPNLRVLADVDPSLATAESNESDNQFPVSGVPGAVDVRALPTFNLRFVPVLQQVNGLSGNVSAANKESFLADLKLVLPVGAYDADVRAPYTTTAPVLQNDNANGAWGAILSEVLALRTADGSSRYYYGVVKASYGSGVAGMAYVGGSARTALGWDYLPSGSGILAHELGHNLGRSHAPCGGANGQDPGFPYAGGKIGMWGLDLSTLTLKSPFAFADLMGYCSPSWVSDYSWSGMVTYRQSGPNNAPAAGESGAGLLVWGRITDAGVVLEPSFRVPATGRAPSPGANRLELLGADGSLLRTVAFGVDTVADLPSGAEGHFAFVVPLDAGLERGLAGVRVRAAGRVGSRLASALASDPAPVVSRPNARQVEIRWDAARFPMVMVRDAASGQILSFARGGAARLWTDGATFDLQFSDGVNSVVRQRQIR